MTRKQRRAVMIGTGLAILGLAVGLVLVALRDTLVFFHTPSDVVEKQLAAGQRFRLGGLVGEGSVKKGADGEVSFVVTDSIKSLNVRYRGVLPDLFREGQGVVAEGKLVAADLFQADSVLAKHDETYMPPEVAKALKDKGVWQGTPAAGGDKKSEPKK